MTTLIVLLGSAGVALLVSGLPLLRRTTLGHRVEPYLSGLHGKPSTLLQSPRPRSALLGQLGARVQAWTPWSQTQLPERLASVGANVDAVGFRIEQLTWAGAATLGVWVLMSGAAAAGLGLDARLVPLATGLAFASGWLARDWWLGREIERRRALLQEEMPTAIDLMTLSIVSGESIPAAFARVGALLGEGVGSEFRKTVGDMRAGAPIVEALEDMKRRVQIHAMARFVDALITAIERGAPLADVLRAQAEDGREARRRFLLESGGRREVLMLVPVVFLIMPVVVVFTLLPGLVALDLLVP